MKKNNELKDFLDSLTKEEMQKYCAKASMLYEQGKIPSGKFKKYMDQIKTDPISKIVIASHIMMLIMDRYIQYLEQARKSDNWI